MLAISHGSLRLTALFRGLCTHSQPQEKKLGFWHQSDEAENRVGGMLALVASSAVFLAPDSPLGFIGRDHTILGVVLAVAISVVVYEYDRYKTRLVMQRRAPHLPRVSSMSLLNVQSGTERMRKLMAALDCLDFSFVGAKLLAQKRIGQAEAEILALLTDAPPDELNYILTNTQLAYLLYKVKDGDVMAVGKTSSSTRTAILELLAIRRLHELELEARVSLLDAFQVCVFSLISSKYLSFGKCIQFALFLPPASRKCASPRTLGPSSGCATSCSTRWAQRSCR